LHSTLADYLQKNHYIAVKNTTLQHQVVPDVD
jgi:hypothetical protein